MKVYVVSDKSHILRERKITDFCKICWLSVMQNWILYILDIYGVSRLGCISESVHNLYSLLAEQLVCTKAQDYKMNSGYNECNIHIIKIYILVLHCAKSDKNGGYEKSK